MKLFIAILGVIFAICPRICIGADYTSMYSIRMLEAAAETYNDNLIGIWNEDLIGQMPRSDRRAASRVKLRIPLIKNHRNPFHFSADAGIRRVYLPTLSVKFFDELAIASAWFDHNGCNMDAVFDYVGMIRYQEFTRPIPSPLSALPVPSDALSNLVVNNVSGRVLKSAVYFLMSHELAHVLYEHTGFVSIAQSQRQELEADAYALELMRRLSVSSAEPVPPIGIVHFFRAASRFERTPGDFDSVESYEEYLRRDLTHPLSSARLISVAQSIRDNANDFAGRQAVWRSKIETIANQIETIGRTLDDSRIRELQRHRSLQVSMGSLQAACD